MKIIIANNYEEMSKKAAEEFKNKLDDIKVMGLATGSTPVGMYKELVKLYENGKISFKDKISVNLDEYIGLPTGHKESYREFMNDNFFNHIDIDKNNTYVPFAKSENDKEACDKYDEILKNNPVDLQILGIGENGHIAFNEPDENLKYSTNIVKLTDSTIEANARFFNSKDEVPTHAISMGVGKIMEAKEIFVLANGKKKADAVKRLLFSDDITCSCPVTLLKLHSNVTLFIDGEIATELGIKENFTKWKEK